MRATRIMVVGMLLLGIAAVGCSKKTGPTTRTLANALPTSPAPNDTVPSPPPPPEPPVIQPALFLSYADTTAAGEVAHTRWLLGNDSDQPFTMHYAITSAAGWPGFPKEGDVPLASFGTQELVVPVVVPAGTAPGMYEIDITVTRPGNLTYFTEGVIRVHG